MGFLIITRDTFTLYLALERLRSELISPYKDEIELEPSKIGLRFQVQMT